MAFHFDDTHGWSEMIYSFLATSFAKAVKKRDFCLANLPRLLETLRCLLRSKVTARESQREMINSFN